MNNHG
jgi:hypothetical protein